MISPDLKSLLSKLITVQLPVQIAPSKVYGTNQDMLCQYCKSILQMWAQGSFGGYIVRNYEVATLDSFFSGARQSEKQCCLEEVSLFNKVK